MRYVFKDKFSGFSHLLGAVTGLLVLAWLLSRNWSVGGLRLISSFIFAGSFTLLYLSSAVYHLSDVTPEQKRLLKRIDHSMIFVFIAGTYTPFCLLPLHGPWGWSIFGVVWGATLLGLFVKLFWLHAKRWVSTVLYLLVGWVAIAAIVPLSHDLTASGFAFLVAGGLFYSVGAVIYAAKWPDPFPNLFGFHEIWHLFVLAGSFCHVLSVATVL